MEAWLFGLIFIGLLGGISIILILLKCHMGFIITFFFHGSIYISISIWESSIWNPSDGYYCFGAWDWSWGFWGLLMTFLIPLTFLTMLVYAQSREENYKMFGKKYTIEASIFLMLLAGDWMTFGAFEDFGCYIIWGLENFYRDAQVFHGDRFLWGIPILYYMIIPGLILQVLGLWFSRRLIIGKRK